LAIRITKSLFVILYLLDFEFVLKKESNSHKSKGRIIAPRLKASSQSVDNERGIL